MKKRNILIGILCLSALYSCNDHINGNASPLHLKPKKLDFEHQNDTMIVSAARTSFWIGRSESTTKNVYYSSAQDTMYDGWIKAVAFSNKKEVKVIVYDNDTEYDRYYEIDVYAGNTGEILEVIQRAKNL